MNQQMLIQHMRNQGLNASMISIRHLKALEADITEKMDSGLIEGENLRSMFKRNFDFNVPASFASAQSIIVVAAPHPMFNVQFHTEGYLHHVIIPPTYNNREVTNKVKDALEAALLPNQFQIVKAKLPAKLAAVRSGLGRYGRNNICYVEGSGSFVWLGVYFSDMACDADAWQETSIMSRCKSCAACIKACPTKAIGTDRFLLHAKRCITLYNEFPDHFPEWLEDSYHNTLVGCLHCQLACPENEINLENIQPTVSFSAEETRQILDNIPLEMLSEHTLEKLDAIDWKDEYAYLHRNLGLLIDTEKE